MWTLGEFNTLPADAIAQGLAACCASPQWVGKVASGRPYGSLAALREAAAAAFDELGEDELELAHAAHPRIGEPIRGQSGGPPLSGAGGREQTWSKAEQSRANTAGEAVQRELAEANRDYERRFGRVFLICATGLTGEEILVEAKRRLGNDAETEAAEAAAELRKIVLLRLEKAMRT